MRQVVILCFAVFAACWSSPLHAAIISIEGTIKSVDTKKRTITVETGSESKSFDVSSEVKIALNGKEASLDSLKSGQTVDLSYHDELEIVVKIAVQSSKPKDGGQTTISLFDGKTLKGWKTLDGDTIQGWAVENGELVSLPDKKAPLLTMDNFDDFEFECEFWLDKKGNSGVYLRGRYEVQLLDDPNWPGVEPKKKCGSIWGRLAPSDSVYLGPKRWNTLAARIEGKRVTVILNKAKVIDNRLILGGPTSAMAIDDLEDQPGPIAIKNEGTIVRFRNLKIRRLKK